MYARKEKKGGAGDHEEIRKKREKNLIHSSTRLPKGGEPADSVGGEGGYPPTGSNFFFRERKGNTSKLDS